MREKECAMRSLMKVMKVKWKWKCVSARSDFIHSTSNESPSSRIILSRSCLVELDWRREKFSSFTAAPRLKIKISCHSELSFWSRSGNDKIIPVEHQLNLVEMRLALEEVSGSKVTQHQLWQIWYGKCNEIAKNKYQNITRSCAYVHSRVFFLGGRGGWKLSVFLLSWTFLMR